MTADSYSGARCEKSFWSRSCSSPHLSLNRGGRWGTTGDFTTSFLHFSLFSAALWDLANSRPVHSLMLSGHLFFCPGRFPFTVPYKMVLARPEERETCPYHFSLRHFGMVRRSSCGPNACWISAQTSSLFFFVSDLGVGLDVGIRFCYPRCRDNIPPLPPEPCWTRILWGRSRCRDIVL